MQSSPWNPCPPCSGALGLPPAVTFLENLWLPSPKPVPFWAPSPGRVQRPPPPSTEPSFFLVGDGFPKPWCPELPLGNPRLPCTPPVPSYTTCFRALRDPVPQFWDIPLHYVAPIFLELLLIGIQIFWSGSPIFLVFFSYFLHLHLFLLSGRFPQLYLLPLLFISLVLLSYFNFQELFLFLQMFLGYRISLHLSEVV